MYENPLDLQAKFFKPLKDIWVERIRAAQNAKTRFDKIGTMCHDFYESQRGFMWKQAEYFNGKLPQPRFAITIAKAFEFVAIYGPHLYWQYADRKVSSQKRLKLTPDMFGDPNDPQVQQKAEEVMSAEAQEQSLQNFLNEMMQIYLNWSQREQPGSLIVHGMMSIIDSLIKGVGLLWPETYTPPGSNDKFTKLRHDSIDNLLVDSDCKDPLWETANFIMLRHITPVWQVEKMFGLKRGSLGDKGTHASAELNARMNANQATNTTKTFDCLEWYEIWSKAGIGPRTTQLNHHMIDMFDDQLGDFAYLCISEKVDFPLNAPPEKFFGEDAAGEEEINEMFQWRCRDYGDPFPCFMDNRWPVSVLTYNPVVGSAWPMAPLAPGLGELIAINILTTCYIDMAWSKRKEILAYHQSAASELEEAIESDEAFVKVKLNDNIHQNINEVLQFIQRPNTQSDILHALDIMSANFDRRVGLNPMQYGESKTQIRVASDSRAKMNAISIRPEKMSGDVGRWMSDASQLEMFLAVLHVSGQSLTHLLGAFGGSQWDMAFEDVPIAQVMREMKATVDASEVRRPDKERDTANVQAMQQFVLPILQTYAQETTDTKPLNEFFVTAGDAMDMHGPVAELPPWKPPAPDEEQQAMQKASQQAQLQKVQAEAASKAAAAEKSKADSGRSMADTQRLGADTQRIMVEAAVKAQEANRPTGGMIDEMKHDQEMRHREESHLQNMIQTAEEKTQMLLFDAIEGQQDLQQKKQQTSDRPSGSSNS